MGITDACTMDDGALVFSAVAEDTGNAYEDGRCLGAAIGMLDDDFNVVQLELVKPVVKIEGINAWRTSTGFRFLAVTDADAPSVAASLFEGSARF
ncbi:MAG: hypothetical protein KKD02_11660 [Alphaproteobacteria bacterium]|nr:hypothetical protein [Alphaproteobacteria bacterium]